MDTQGVGRQEAEEQEKEEEEEEEVLVPAGVPIN
jgi:hypothetical protein